MVSQVAYEFSRMASSYSYSYSDSEEEDFGSGGYLDSQEEEEGDEEGSSWDEQEFSVKVVEVAGGADLVGGWGPGGLLEGCAVTLREEELRAAFIVTGGKSSSGIPKSSVETVFCAFAFHISVFRKDFICLLW